MGAFIGDALALGPHWYYDLAEMRRDYGDWITGYTDPRPGRYHAGLKAGQSSQAGFILKLLLSSLVGRYDEADFCRRMDEELLPRCLTAPRQRTGWLYQPVDPRVVAPARGTEAAVGEDCRTCRYHGSD
jgi:hypothetical protein